jgi:hypothetical protein
LVAERVRATDLDELALLLEAQLTYWTERRCTFRDERDFIRDEADGRKIRST